MHPAFLIRKASPSNALLCEKSSTLNAEKFTFIEAADAGGLTPGKDNNDDERKIIKFKAYPDSFSQLILFLLVWVYWLLLLGLGLVYKTWITLKCFYT